MKTTIKLLVVLALTLLPVTAVSAKGLVTQHVSAGARDPFANFSPTATIFADGSMSGEYTDRFPQIGGGFHAALNCVSIVGNDAWVSGVIISGTANGPDLTGMPVATRVRDNGTSARLSVVHVTPGTGRDKVATVSSLNAKSCQRPSPQCPGTDLYMECKLGSFMISWSRTTRSSFV